MEALKFADWALRRGLSLREAADCLWLPPSTLLHWRSRQEEDGLDLRARGRRPSRGTMTERNTVVRELLEQPAISVHELQARFPALPRREVEELRWRFRQGCSDWCHALRWLTPGRVWAIDYSHAPHPIDGIYPYLLMVRDLASGFQLLALPCRVEDAETTGAALQSLFAEHGEPLLLKLDNGSPLRAAGVTETLARAGVEILPSPPYTPSYNGSIEAGNGSIKTRTHHEAARQCRPAAWTSDDVEAARYQANESARPGGTSPAASWASRSGITLSERVALRETIGGKRYAEMTLRKTSEQVISKDEADEVTREVTRQALVELGHLVIERRSIPLAKRGRSRANNP